MDRFLVILLQCTIIYSLEVIYIQCICTVEIVCKGMLRHISSQFSIRPLLEIDCGQSIYSTEINECNK